MRYAGIISNDIAAGTGVNVSFFVQGCPIHCPGCHNPQTWDFGGGKEFTHETLVNIINLLTANNVHRNLSIMGGEPLCKENLFLTSLIVQTVKDQLPNTKIFIWTGYLYEDLVAQHDNYIDYILTNADVLVDGPYIQEERDITLKMRGSRNQRIINLKNKETE